MNLSVTFFSANMESANTCGDIRSANQLKVFPRKETSNPSAFQRAEVGTAYVFQIRGFRHLPLLAVSNRLGAQPIMMMRVYTSNTEDHIAFAVGTYDLLAGKTFTVTLESLEVDMV